MKWLVTLRAASENDVSRLLDKRIEGLSAIPDEPRQLLWTADLPDEPEEGGSEEGDALAYAEIRAFLVRLNGMARLRWGRAFQGLELHSTQVVEASGEIGARVFVGAATGFLPYEDFVLLAEGMGLERPPKPKGLEQIEGVDFDAALATAEENPAAARAIQLVDLMLRDVDQINWSAAYAALEIVQHELRRHGVKGHRLEWWTKGELNDFTATANSPEVLGVAARHGRPSGLSEARMSANAASWFIRRVVALWLVSPYARASIPGSGCDQCTA
jgi:hypothetical protein